jgi:transposase-like protein
MSKNNYPPSEIETHLSNFNPNQESMASYCRRVGLNPSTLSKWRKNPKYSNLNKYEASFLPVTTTDKEKLACILESEESPKSTSAIASASVNESTNNNSLINQSLSLEFNLPNGIQIKVYQ